VVFTRILNQVKLGPHYLFNLIDHLNVQGGGNPMNDQSKTKQVLIQELALLRQRIKEMERSESEYQLTEQALHESEDLSRSYIEEAPDGVYISDLEGNLLYGNRKCEEMIGYRREELIGKNFVEVNFLPEHSLNVALRLLQANLEGQVHRPGRD